MLFAQHASAGTKLPIRKADAPIVPIDTATYGAILVLDEASGNTLFEYNATTTWTAASLTKLMTAYVFTSTRTNWTATGNVITADEVGGGRLQVPAGTTMSVKDVLYSAIVGSANNASQALARLYDGRSVNDFIQKMNSTASVLGMDQTTYNDPSGMNPRNVTTAYDIATILLESAKHAEIQKAMVTPVYSFATRSPVIQKNVKNTNDLLFIEPELIVTAGKTGYLEESRYNYAVRLHPKNDPEKSLVIVVFGASSRSDSVQASTKLARWAWNAHDWSSVVSSYEFTQNLLEGQRGSDVKHLQAFLNAQGYTIAASGPGAPGAETDFFGSMTKAALKRFQEAHAIETLQPKGSVAGSGYLDAVTRSYIHSQKPPTKPIPTSSGLLLPAMGIGSQGAAVRTLQELLARDPEVYPERIISGMYGTLTKRAVQRFQMKHGITRSASDPGYGYLGPKTRAMLRSLYGG